MHWQSLKAGQVLDYGFHIHDLRHSHAWHVGVQEELDELKQEKRNIKKQIQLVDGIIKEDLYTAYYAVSEKEEIVADREIEIPGMEDVAIEPETNVVVMNPDKLSDAKKTKDVAVAPINESMAKLTGTYF